MICTFILAVLVLILGFLSHAIMGWKDYQMYAGLDPRLTISTLGLIRFELSHAFERWVDLTTLLPLLAYPVVSLLVLCDSKRWQWIVFIGICVCVCLEALETIMFGEVFLSGLLLFWYEAWVFRIAVGKSALELIAKSGTTVARVAVRWACGITVVLIAVDIWMNAIPFNFIVWRLTSLIAGNGPSELICAVHSVVWLYGPPVLTALGFLVAVIRISDERSNTPTITRATLENA